MLTSPRTVEAYALGTRQFIEYATTQAINLLRPNRHDAQGTSTPCSPRDANPLAFS
ncbi:hypothetical protein ACFSC4_31130 [Deinococcus malanensis]|uniref:hypothetical protein n=1 Tax=Deinococcus malanensis TaxID=1706855 RepID=UPI0036440964